VAKPFHWLAGFLSGKAMRKKSLYHQTLVMGLFLLSGCELTQNAQRDFNRLVHSNPFATASSRPAPSSQQAYSPPPRRAPAAAPTEPRSEQKPDESKTPDDPKVDPQQAAAVTPAPTPPAPPVSLVGKSEGQVRAMLGPPNSVEERAPGKTWHYRDGRCSVDVQLYPDVQTRQFGTLAYEVKSDDNSDEGRRDCLARLNSRAQ
jgi:glucose/arabinose dehydrogenase